MDGKLTEFSEEAVFNLNSAANSGYREARIRRPTPIKLLREAQSNRKLSRSLGRHQLLGKDMDQ